MAGIGQATDHPPTSFQAVSATQRRRGKSALFLAVCGVAGLGPHWLEPGLRLLPASALALLLGGYSIRTVLVPALSRTRGADVMTAAPASATQLNGAGSADPPPAVDVVVAARDEQAVIGRLVEGIARLRYPREALRLWVIDDGSSDRTPQVLADLQAEHPFLRVLRREPDAGGGKSGALNLALQHVDAPWVLVLDADADLQPDTLERLIPLAEQGGWAGVQLRKAVANPEANWLTRAQAMEMALDTVVQEGRLSCGGVVELRGNGQLLRRTALEGVGGFNEDTVTDDLDLSFRLLLHQQPLAVVWDPPVAEEAVLGLPALWRQRQRWAEGGLQRFFDYAPGLLSDRLSPGCKLDLLCFFVLQYVLPVVAVADLLGALITRSLPTIWPLSFVAFGLSGMSILQGCRRGGEGPQLPRMHPANLLLGILYLGHWFIVIPFTTLRMALLPKRLVWAKTMHLGEDPAAA
jgi:1,2-diacylglycerol 3-beta-glucosyltransferase